VLNCKFQSAGVGFSSVESGGVTNTAAWLRVISVCARIRDPLANLWANTGTGTFADGSRAYISARSGSETRRVPSERTERPLMAVPLGKEYNVGKANCAVVPDGGGMNGIGVGGFTGLAVTVEIETVENVEMETVENVEIEVDIKVVTIVLITVSGFSVILNVDVRTVGRPGRRIVLVSVMGVGIIVETKVLTTVRGIPHVVETYVL
jgi:hypothetical protein